MSKNYLLVNNNYRFKAIFNRLPVIKAKYRER